jgi:hypothetical protein
MIAPQTLSGVEIIPADKPEKNAPGGWRSALQRSEIEKWWPIIKAAGIKAE